MLKMHNICVSVFPCPLHVGDATRRKFWWMITNGISIHLYYNIRLSLLIKHYLLTYLLAQHYLQLAAKFVVALAQLVVDVDAHLFRLVTWLVLLGKHRVPLAQLSVDRRSTGRQHIRHQSTCFRLLHVLVRQQLLRRHNTTTTTTTTTTTIQRWSAVKGM